MGKSKILLTILLVATLIAIFCVPTNNTAEAITASDGKICITEAEGYTVMFMLEGEWKVIDSFDHYPSTEELMLIAPPIYDRMYIVTDIKVK